MVRHSGLCTTCYHSPGCVNHGTRQRPIFECEEFFQSANGSATHSKPDPEPDNDRPATTGHAFEGLCCNCNHRNHCMMRRVEGGIWHCEEYE